MSESVGPSIYLFGIPLPPSVNEQYATILRGNIPIRIPSKIAKQYEKIFWQWKLSNSKAVNQARDDIVKWNSPLEIEMYVAITKERMFTKDGRLKSWDVTNRSKSLHDLLASVLGIDDKLFVSTPMQKIVADVCEEQVVVVLRPSKVNRFSEMNFFGRFQGKMVKTEGEVKE